jgi:HK97 family phage portal protein
LIAVACDIAASGAMTRQQHAFYVNQARPSTVLTTDMVLTKEQVDSLRDRWNEQSRGLAAGGTPILTAGLKPQQLASSAKDSELAEVMKLTEQHIALAFRVPLQILGIGGTPYASTELLMQSWIASGLGFAINHIEEAFGQLFGLKGLPDEYLEFDTAALLRSALKDRIESYAAGTRAGIFAPNEAREQFELAKVPDGDEPRMQQQDVPLSYGAQLDPTPPPQKPVTAPAEPPPAKEIANDNERLRQSFRAAHARNLAV